MKKILLGSLFLFGMICTATAGQLMQSYETQITTTAFAGFASAKEYIGVPCRLYGVVLANPGALTQDVMLYDGTTLVGEIESDNAENDFINFDVPININTSFNIKSTTATAGTYATVYYKVGNYLSETAQRQLLFTHILASGTAQDMSSTPVIIRKIIISAISAQTVTLTDDSTEIAKIYCAATSVTQRDLYNSPVYISNLKYASSAAAEDSFIIIQYEPAFAPNGWNMLVQRSTDTRLGGTFPAKKTEVANIWFDSQSTAETITVSDGATAELIVYVADDGTVTHKFDDYIVFDTSITITSSQDTTNGYVTVIYR